MAVSTVQNGVMPRLSVISGNTSHSMQMNAAPTSSSSPPSDSVHLSAEALGNIANGSQILATDLFNPLEFLTVRSAPVDEAPATPDPVDDGSQANGAGNSGSGGSNGAGAANGSGGTSGTGDGTTVDGTGDGSGAGGSGGNGGNNNLGGDPNGNRARGSIDLSLVNRKLIGFDFNPLNPGTPLRPFGFGTLPQFGEVRLFNEPLTLGDPLSLQGLSLFGHSQLRLNFGV